MGPGATCRPALGGHPAQAEAHARERRRGDERRGDARTCVSCACGPSCARSSRAGPGRLEPRRLRLSWTPGTRRAGADSTRTSTARSTRPAPPSSTPPGAGSRTRCSGRARQGGARRARTARPQRRAARDQWLERVQRLVVVRPEGPAGLAGATRCGRVQDAVLRRGRCREVRGLAVGRARRGGRRARGGAGDGFDRVASRRDGGADPVRTGDPHPDRCAARTSPRSSRRSRSPRTGRDRLGGARERGATPRPHLARPLRACRLGRLRT